MRHRFTGLLVLPQKKITPLRRITISLRFKCPTSEQITRRRSAMSLMSRLKALQTEVEVPLPDLSHLTLTDLKSEVVAFGSKHQGESYEKAWEDQSWISFMVAKYGNSKVLSHRRLLRFVELMIEHHEQMNAQVPVLPPPESLAGSYTVISETSGHRSIRAKAKAMHIAPSGASMDLPLDIEEEQAFEMYNQGTTEATPYAQDPNVIALQERMLHMENALGRVIKHLEEQAEKNTQKD
jgi:hypothetical protein